MSKCKSCKHWNMEHTLEDHNGCRVWNNYKHLGQPPMQPTEGITCEQCGHHNSIIGRNLTEEEYHKAKADAFELNLINDGPTEPFEGWVRGMGIGLVNNSIITKSEDTCKYYKARDTPFFIKNSSFYSFCFLFYIFYYFLRS